MVAFKNAKYKYFPLVVSDFGNVFYTISIKFIEKYLKKKTNSEVKMRNKFYRLRFYT